MRISIVGNCQIGGLAKCVRALRPDVQPEALSMDALPQRFGNRGAMLQHLKASDHVFFHRYEQPQLYGSAEDLLRELPQAREVPFVSFSGYHPDMVYVQQKLPGGAIGLLKSPVGDNHSALALFGWKAGLDVAATVRLFQPQVYRRVDFRAMWTSSEKALGEVGKRTQCPLGTLLVHWSRRGCFMHTLNHPKVFVLADIARWMLDQAGLAYPAVAVEDLVIDDLMTSTIWPVYEGLATGFGLRGSDRFKKEMETTFFDLERFVAESHAIYARHPVENVMCWLSDYWLGDPTLRQDLIHLATR